MPRIRAIKPEFFKHERLSELTAHHRLLLIGLWTLADKAGRLEDRPRRIKAELFPYEDVDVESMLKELESNADNFITRYAVESCNYIQINSFHKHQRPHPSEKDSNIPALSDKKPFLSDKKRSLSDKDRIRNAGVKGFEFGVKGLGLRVKKGELINPPNPPLNPPTVVGQPSADSSPEPVVRETKVVQDHQLVVDLFLKLKGVDTGDKKQVGAMYKRHARTAVALIKEAGNVDTALLAVGWASVTFDKKGLSWTLETVAKHLPNFWRHGKEDLIGAKYNLTPNQIENLKRAHEWMARNAEPEKENVT